MPSESYLHRFLTEEIISYIKRTYDRNNIGILHSDLDLPEKLPIPPNINGHIPDVYYENEKMIVIGEAKTGKDIESPRSKKQYKSFITWSVGKRETHLIIATPWFAIPSAKNCIQKISKSIVSSNIHFIYLENLPDTPQE